MVSGCEHSAARRGPWDDGHVGNSGNSGRLHRAVLGRGSPVPRARGVERGALAGAACPVPDVAAPRIPGSTGQISSGPSSESPGSPGSSTVMALARMPTPRHGRCEDVAVVASGFPVALGRGSRAIGAGRGWGRRAGLPMGSPPGGVRSAAGAGPFMASLLVLLRHV